MSVFVDQAVASPCLDGPGRRREGVSFASSFDDAEAESLHKTQYFEMFGGRAIDHDGWRAVCGWPGPNFTEAAKKNRRIGTPITREALDDLEMNGWELYHIAEDPTESHNVAAENPAKLSELITRWWKERLHVAMMCQ